MLFRSWPERAAKWVRRHGRALAFVAVAAVLAGVSLAFWWREQVRDAELAARTEANRRRALSRIPFDKGQELFLRRPPDLDGARKLFSQAIADDPGFADAWYARARTRPLPAQALEAIDDLHKAAELDPSLIMARFHAGKIYMERLKDTEAARAEFAAMRRVDAENEYSLLGEAWLCTLENRWDKALELAGFAARANPELDEVHSLRGYVFSAMHSTLRDPARAVAEYDAYLARCPDDVTALNNRGFNLKQLGRAAEAERDLDRALGLDPNYVYALDIRGSVRVDRGDLAGALADFNRALAINPGNSNYLLNRGGIYERMGRLDEAGNDYRSAARLAPENADPVRALAILELRSGGLEEAGRLFDRLLASGKFAGDNHLKRLRGYAAWFAGDRKTAEAAWRQGVRERPPGAKLYSALPLWRLLVASGRAAEASAMLAEAAADKREKPHLAAVARHCLGGADLAAALEGADSAPLFCETFYYLGVAASARGDAAAAAGWFQACRATGFPAYSEYDLAAMELGALPLAPEAPVGTAAGGAGAAEKAVSPGQTPASVPPPAPEKKP